MNLFFTLTFLLVTFSVIVEFTNNVFVKLMFILVWFINFLVLLLYTGGIIRWKLERSRSKGKNTKYKN